MANLWQWDAADALSDLSFENYLNYQIWDTGVWRRAEAGDGFPGDADTIELASETAPDDDLPAAGTFHFQVSTGLTVDIADWLGGATLGNVSVSGSGIVTANNITGTVSVTDDSSLYTSTNVGDAAGDTVTVGVGAVMTFGAALTVAGPVALAGYLQSATGDAIAFTSAVTLSDGGGLRSAHWDFNAGLDGTGGEIGNAGVMTITGNVNVTNCTWDVDVDSTLTIDNAGALTLDLGTASVPNLAVVINNAGATVTLAADMAGYGFTLTAGILAGGGVTLALGAGAFTSTKGTVTGMLNVVVGAGGIVYAAGTYSAATLNVTVPAGVTTTVLSWGTTTNKITALVIDGNATFSGETQCASFGGGGTAALSTRQLKILPAESNFWTFSGTISGTNAAALTIFPSANISNTQCILGPSVGGTVISGVLSANKTVTADGGLTCGPLLIAGSTSPGLAMGTGNLTCGAITLGPTGATATGGRLVLGTGTATFTTLAGGNAANSGNTLTCNSSRINLGGNMTLAGLAADFGTGSIRATAAALLSGENATSVANAGADLFSDGGVKLLTIDYIPALATPLRTWCGCVDGTHNTAGQVVFHPGAPSALALMGCGV